MLEISFDLQNVKAMHQLVIQKAITQLCQYLCLPFMEYGHLIVDNVGN